MSKGNIVGFIVLAILFIGVVVLRNWTQDDLKKNGVLVKAKIVLVNFGGKGSNGGFQCKFDYKGKTIEHASPSTVKSGKYNFIGKSFPGMYSPGTGTFEILITPTDFEKFNIPFPDSLNWVMEYVIDK